MMVRSGSWSKLAIGAAVLSVAAAVLFPTAPALAAPAPRSGIELELVVNGLSQPVDLTAPGGDDRLFIVEKAGRIRIVEDGELLTTPFLDITGPVKSGGEQGLLGLAFHPNYAKNGRFYVNYTADAGNGDTRIVEYRVSGADPNRADPTTAKTLLTIDQFATNHNGGALAFGPDGYLYVGVGDGGGGGDPGNHGQNKNTLLGSILRIRPKTGLAPADNPFVNKDGANKIWAYGVRNPWRISFDAATGDLFIADVGQSTREEVSIAPKGVGGINFGWDIEEGSSCHDNKGVGCGSGALTRPVHEYGHNQGCSITGGYVYRGNDLPQLRGHYFYADYCSDFVKSFRVRNGKAVDHTDWTATLDPPDSPSSFGIDGFGELYIVSLGGSVWKLVPSNDAPCDFDGDGDSDLVVGVPGEDLAGDVDRGLVHVVERGMDGLETGTDTQLRVDSGVGHGTAVACGDFDGDEFDDLAMGAPEAEDVPGGSVSVAYGSGAGLSEIAHRFTPDRPGIPGGTQPGDRFGSALATGDFDRDGYDDLAIGAPGRDAGGVADSGAVFVLYGGGGGLSGADAQRWHQDTKGILNSAEEGDLFGFALTSADFDGDGFADLAVGAPGEAIKGVADAGLVQVLFGKGSGLGKRDQLLHQDSKGTRAPISGAMAGYSLASGHVDGGGFDDLVVGSPGVDGGSVMVVFGGRKGPTRKDKAFELGRDGWPGTADPGDQLGAAAVVADFNNDGYDDIAVGAPGDEVAGAAGAGSVLAMYGASKGPRKPSAQLWTRRRPGVGGKPLQADGFGSALQAGRYDRNGRYDLAVGVPQADAGGRGEVTVIYGKGRLRVAGSQRIHQDRSGFSNTGEPGDRFGAGL